MSVLNRGWRVYELNVSVSRRSIQAEKFFVCDFINCKTQSQNFYCFSIKSVSTKVDKTGKQSMKISQPVSDLESINSLHASVIFI